MRNKNRFLIVLIMLFITGDLFSQIRISSPYSRYGLGDLQAGRQARNMAMGGIGYGYRDNLAVNIMNPASYSGFDSMSFVCDVGLISQFNQLQTSSTVQKFNNLTTLGYISFGFPLARWCGVSIGLIPYSQTGYKLIVHDSIESVGKVTQKYEGNGSLNRFYLGSGFKLHRDLSFGFNVSFLFGTLNHIKSAYFTDLSYVFDSRLTSTVVINDFQFEAGLQYHRILTKDYYLNAGLVYLVPYDLSGRKTSLAERFVTSSTGSETTKDTVEFDYNKKGRIHYPGGLGGGVFVGQKNYWMAGVDLAWQNWDRYTSFGLKDSLSSDFRFSTGMSLTPRHTSLSGYFRKMTYRAGFRYQNTYLKVRGHQLNEYAIGLGFGFPFRKTGSSINLSFEFGQRGILKEDLIRETFIRGILSLSIKELWFFRRKAD